MKHECHKVAVLKTITLPTTTGNVGEMLSSELGKQQLKHSQCFLKLLSNVRFLSRQGLAFRGDGNELDSNFMQLLYLRSEDDTKLADWEKTHKYTSPEMQNEIIKCMYSQKDFCKSSEYPTLTTDVSNIEQVVICLRWVSEKFEAH